MPYINIRTNIPIPAEKDEALKAGCFGVISSCLGKSSSWVMVNIEDNCRLSLGADNAPCAFVEVRNAGPLGRSQCSSMTAPFASVLSKETGIPEDRVYVTFGTPTAWGWNGGLF